LKISIKGIEAESLPIIIKKNRKDKKLNYRENDEDEADYGLFVGDPTVDVDPVVLWTKCKKKWGTLFR